MTPVACSICWRSAKSRIDEPIVCSRPWPTTKPPAPSVDGASAADVEAACASPSTAKAAHVAEDVNWSRSHRQSGCTPRAPCRRTCRALATRPASIRWTRIENIEGSHRPTSNIGQAHADTARSGLSRASRAAAARRVRRVRLVSRRHARSCADAASLAGSQRILPDGCAELIFHFRGRFRAISATGQSLRQPACFVVGLLTSPFVIAPAAHVDTMGVQVPAGRRVPLLPGSTVRPDRSRGRPGRFMGQRHAARRLWQQLAERRRAATAARSAAQRDIARASPPRRASVEHDRATASAVGDLVGTSGRASIDSVAARAGMTTTASAAPVRGPRRREPEGPRAASCGFRGRCCSVQPPIDRGPTGCALPSSAATPIRAT